MKQETIADYHDMHKKCKKCKKHKKHKKHKKPAKKYHAIQIRDTVTGRKRWAVVWFEDNVMYKRFPTTYGMRSAVRLANRLNKEWGKMGGIVGDSACS